VKEDEYDGSILFMYENRKMKPDETVLMREGGRIKEKDADNLIKIYYKHLCKCHNVPPYNYNMLIIKKYQKSKII
jgi:hypothetical protein